MGIKGLPQLISTHVGSYAIKSYPFAKFANMKVSIDTSLLVHKIGIAFRSKGKDLTNSKGQLTSHLYGIFYTVLVYLQNGIKPIFVFDGKAPDIKNNILQERSKRKKRALEKLQNLENSEDEEYIKNFKQTFSPNKNDYKELQIMLDLMGIPYIIAPGEADVVCAWLSSRQDPTTGKYYVKGVCSDDSDMLALGARYLFKDMLKPMNATKSIKVISLYRTLIGLNLNLDQFVDLCVLLGCDYCDNIKGIGSSSALRLINSHKNLKNVISFLKKNNKLVLKDIDIPQEDVEKCMLDASHYFKNALKELDNSNNFILTDDNLELRQFQHDELLDFMCTKHGFDVDRMRTGLSRLEKYYEIMHIKRPNIKKVYQLSKPLSENILFRNIEDDDINFLSSDDENNNKKKVKGDWKYKTNKISNLSKTDVIVLHSNSDSNVNDLK